MICLGEEIIFFVLRINCIAMKQSNILGIILNVKKSQHNIDTVFIYNSSWQNPILVQISYNISATQVL